MAKCEYCGKQYTKNQNNQKYCSRQCKSNFNNEKNRDKSISARKYPNGFGLTNCKECGIKFEKSSAITKFCSVSCRNKYHRELNKVKSNNIYLDDVDDFVYSLIKDGLSAKNNTVSDNYKYGMISSVLRDKISSRDNYSCRICKADTNLEIHHIVKLIHGGNNDSSNLITLCKSCHRAIDTLDYNHAVRKCRKNFIDNFNNDRMFKININDVLRDCYKSIDRLYVMASTGDMCNDELIKTLSYMLDLIENNKAD